MATGAADAVAEAWKRLTVTAGTDAEALSAAADCARAVTGVPMNLNDFESEFLPVHQVHKYQPWLTL